MKSVFLFSIFLACTLGSTQASAVETETQKAWKSALNELGSNKVLQEKVVKVFAAIVLERMQTKMEEAHIATNEVEPREVCILSPLTNLPIDELPLGSGIHLNFPLDSEYSGLLSGQFHTCDTVLTGLAGIEDCVLVGAVNQTEQFLAIHLGYSILTRNMKLSSTHVAALELLLGIFRFEGFGNFDLETENLFFRIEFNAQHTIVPFGLRVTNVTLDLGWNEMKIMTGESSLGGQQIDWDSVTRDITALFDVIWPFAREILGPIVEDVITGFIKKCSILDLLTPNPLQCLQPNLLSNTLKETGLDKLFEHDINADETCTNRISLPPIPTTPKQEEFNNNNGAGILEISHLPILGFLTTLYIINQHRRM